MTLSHRDVPLILALLLLAARPAPVAAQVCRMPDAIHASVPAEPAPDGPYTTLGRGETPFDEIPLGIGHLHPASDAGLPALSPGGNDWLRRIELPLSLAPGDEPTGWIARGWIVTPGTPPRPLPIAGMIETGYEEPSFVVMERRADGWLRIRYMDGDAETGLAWVPVCALTASSTPLVFTPWSRWLLSARISPLFLRLGPEGELRSAPSSSSTLLATIGGDHILEPLEVQGDWMRVVYKQPSDYCAPDVVPRRLEGWVRWYSEELGPRVWYFSRGC